MIKFRLAGLLAMAIAGSPLALRSQTAVTNASAVHIKSIKVTNQPLPFRGKLKALDNTAKTITVGTLNIQITSETKISKMGKPATLADGAEGDEVGGSYQKNADGKLSAVSLRFGPKPTTTSTGAKTNKTTKATSP